MLKVTHQIFLLLLINTVILKTHHKNIFTKTNSKLIKPRLKIRKILTEHIFK